MIINDVSNSYQ